MRMAALFTGGKDSTYAMHLAAAQGHEIAVLCTIIPHDPHSMLFHTPSLNHAATMAKAYGLPLETQATRPGGELEALASLLKRCRDRHGVEGVVSGALRSDYQRVRYLSVSDRLGLWHLSPLWHKDQAEYMRTLVREGFRFIVTRISAYGLPPRLLGRVLTPGDVEDIVKRAAKYGFNPAFEGGEAETLVVEAPLMKSRLRVRGRRRLSPDGTGEFLVESIVLEPLPRGGRVGH